MSMIVRPYRADDHSGVVGLWGVAFPEPPPRNDPDRKIAQKLAEQPELFLVAIEDEVVIGTTIAGYDGTRGWIYSVAVDPTRRRQGIGRALVEDAVTRLRARGCPKVNLQVMPENEEVIAFYETLGFQVEERISMGRIV